MAKFEMHGYSYSGEILNVSFKVPVGDSLTLLTALQALTAAGLVEVVTERIEPAKPAAARIDALAAAKVKAEPKPSPARQPAPEPAVEQKADPELVNTEFGLVEVFEDGHETVVRQGEIEGRGLDADAAMGAFLDKAEATRPQPRKATTPALQTETPATTPKRTRATKAAPAEDKPAEQAAPAAAAPAEPVKAQAVPAAKPAAARQAAAPAGEDAVPADLMAAQTFKQVMVWMLDNGFKDKDTIVAKCQEYAAAPVISRCAGNIDGRVERALMHMALEA